MERIAGHNVPRGLKGRLRTNKQSRNQSIPTLRIIKKNHLEAVAPQEETKHHPTETVHIRNKAVRQKEATSAAADVPSCPGSWQPQMLEHSRADTPHVGFARRTS